MEQVVERATDEDEVGYARAVEVEHDRPIDEHGHLRPVGAGELYEAREAPASRKSKAARLGHTLRREGRGAPLVELAGLARGNATHSFEPAGRVAWGLRALLTSSAGVWAHASRSNRSARYESAQSATSSAMP